MSKLKVLKQILEIFKEGRLRKRAFPKLLLTDRAEHFLEWDNKKQRHEYIYKIPPGLCLKSIDSNKNVLASSACMAIFDELDASNFAISDRSLRPGVSVNLSTKLLKPVSAGDGVIISYSCDKIGKTLGFSSFSMRKKEDNSLVAIGRHVKYMPGNYLTDNILSPAAIVLLSYLNRLSSNVSVFKSVKIVDLMTRFLFGTTHEKTTINVAEIESVMESLFKNLKISNEKVDTKNANSSLLTSVSAVDMMCSYEFPITKDLHNMLGHLHGGAIAMSIEESIRAHCGRDIMVHSLNLRYLSVIKGSIGVVKLKKDEAIVKNFKGDISITGEVFCKNDRLAVQFDCYIIEMNSFFSGHATVNCVT